LVQVGNHSDQTIRRQKTSQLRPYQSFGKGTKFHLVLWFSTKRGHRLHRRMDRFAFSSEGLSCLNLEFIPNRLCLKFH
jgi:hypothetical protein